MNLKTKLALEYEAEFKRLFHFTTAQYYQISDAYLAGFDKAREMAVTECQTHDSDGPCDDLGCVAATIKNLGEEGEEEV